MKRINIILSVAEGYLKEQKRIEEACRALGMEVDRTMETLGLISGSIPAERREAIEAIVGVDHIELERGFQLPPPDETKQ